MIASSCWRCLAATGAGRGGIASDDSAAGPAPSDPLEGHPLLRQSITDPRELAEFEMQIDQDLGIEGIEPVGSEKLWEMMIADGIDPNDNEFSRGIVEMREE